MKFLHMADMHFDVPFSSLAIKENLGELRRLEQRSAFKKIIKYIKENNIEYLFIAGDLFEHNSVRKSTIEFINNEFENIKNTKVFIVPGNHDPYIRGSYYETFKFKENVHILNKNFDVYEDSTVKIYGCGFTSFYMNENPLINLNIEKDNEKSTILIMHADVNGVKDENGFSYNPILLSKLRSLNLDYIALGHIHNIDFHKDEKINYSGSTIALGFDELGKHGVIAGNIERGKLSTNFVQIDEKEYVEYDINVENFLSNEEIVEKINELEFNENQFIKIKLIGNRNFNIETNKIYKLINQINVLKIQDCSKLSIDIEKLSQENTLKGMFIKQALEKYNNNIISKEDLDKIIEIGLNAM